MEALINNIQRWLRRNKMESSEHNKESHFFTPKGSASEKKVHVSRPTCIFCKKDHWASDCKSVDTMEMRKRFFFENQLCFSCGQAGHRANRCKSRGCINCKARHHTSLCGKDDGTILTGYTPPVEGVTLPPIIPVQVQGTTLWAYLDTGSSRNFISSDAVKMMKLKLTHHENCQIVTLTGAQKQSMPIYELTINSVDGVAIENVELTRSKMQDFTTVRQPNLRDLK